MKNNTQNCIKNSASFSCYTNNPSNQRKQWRINQGKKKIVREELKDHQEKVSRIIKSDLKNTIERLDKISQEVVDTTKSLEFTQEELHDVVKQM